MCHLRSVAHTLRHPCRLSYKTSLKSYNICIANHGMSELSMTFPGYACVPYEHNSASLQMQTRWIRSVYVSEIFFATATFAPESKLYFADFANHYVIAKFTDNSRALRDLEHFRGATSFVFALQRPMTDCHKTNLLSFYYAQYKAGCGGDVIGDVFEERTMVARASRGFLRTISNTPPRFTFPYQDNIVALEASGSVGHQGLNQYCEKTKTELARHGISLFHMMSMSMLDRLK